MGVPFTAAMPLTTPTLHTARLRLRPFTDADTDAVFALHRSARVLRYWNAPPWTERAQAERFIATCAAMAQEGTGVRLAIERAADGVFIGWCGLVKWNPVHRSASMGYCLDEVAWGQGHATEAASALLQWAFDTLDLHRVQAEADTRNAASARVLEKLGFTREGTLREDCIVDGEVSDTWVYGLLERNRQPAPAEHLATHPATTTPRIAAVEPPYPAELQAEFDRIMRGAPPLRLFRTVARNPRVLQRFLAGGLLDRGSISLRQRELMILRTCALCGAEYEWGVHVETFGAKAGWTPEQLTATVHGSDDDACWSADERAVLLLADQLHRTSTVGESAWHQAAVPFAPEQLIELVMLAGLYHAVSFMVNAFAVEHETSAPRFPPRPTPGGNRQEKDKA